MAELMIPNIGQAFLGGIDASQQMRSREKDIAAKQMQNRLLQMRLQYAPEQLARAEKVAELDLQTKQRAADDYVPQKVKDRKQFEADYLPNVFRYVSSQPVANREQAYNNVMQAFVGSMVGNGIFDTPEEADKYIKDRPWDGGAGLQKLGMYHEKLTGRQGFQPAEVMAFDNYIDKVYGRDRWNALSNQRKEDIFEQWKRSATITDQGGVKMVYTPSGARVIAGEQIGETQPAAAETLTKQDAELQRKIKEDERAEAERQREIKKDRFKSQGALLTTVNTSDRIINEAETALKQISPLSAGFAAQMTSFIGSTPAKALLSTLTQIKAKLGFEELKRMRAESPTGGALGNVSELEIELLQSAIANLDINMPPEQLKERLEFLIGRYNRLKRLAEAEFDIYSGVFDPAILDDPELGISPREKRFIMNAANAEREAGTLKFPQDEQGRDMTPIGGGSQNTLMIDGVEIGVE